MGTLIFKNKKIYILGFLFLLIPVLWFTAPPFSFPSGTIITIREGAGLYALSRQLGEDKVIRSPFWFRLAAMMLGGERYMKAGQYQMSDPQNAVIIAWRVLHGDHDIEVARLTIPEGFTVAEISTLFDHRFSFFDHKDFLAQAPGGYLFPDTYFVPVTATASSSIDLFRNNFSVQIAPHLSAIEYSGHTLEEIITMASILESEARSLEDREIVSGILWKRIKIGMALQVDASFVYVNGKTTKELTQEDLKINSPFNTYLHRGLPPTPISNPGLESIVAALNPKQTPFLYFLTGDDGKMHYARTFEEHVANKLKFINRR